MLAQASTNGQLPKRGLQMPRMNTTRTLTWEKYGAAQPDIKMSYPPVRSMTNDCVRHRQSHIRDVAEDPNLGTYSDWGF